jgi:hypothetical protein
MSKSTEAYSEELYCSMYLPPGATKGLGCSPSKSWYSQPPPSTRWWTAVQGLNAPRPISRNYISACVTCQAEFGPFRSQTSTASSSPQKDKLLDEFYKHWEQRAEWLSLSSPPPSKKSVICFLLPLSWHIGRRGNTQRLRHFLLLRTQIGDRGGGKVRTCPAHRLQHFLLTTMAPSTQKKASVSESSPEVENWLFYRRLQFAYLSLSMMGIRPGALSM